MKKNSEPLITEYSSTKDTLIESIQKIWNYKELIWVFAKRDIQVKYAQTFLGFGWSFFKPLISLIIYVYFFGFLLNWKSGDIPFPVYVLSGLISWNLFSYIVGNGVSSILESTELIKKIYFPKSILPLSKALVGLTETLISTLLLVPLFIYYDLSLSWKIIFMPFALLFPMLCGLAVGFLVSSIAIVKRDLLQILPFMLSMAIWFTPVFFTVNILPPNYQFLMKYNPLSNMVELWRWLLFDSVQFETIWLVNFILVLFFAEFSYYLYSRRENKFADYT